MFTDLALRFMIGGLVVSGFALIGDLFKPKSFAGLFSAAPSVALASLGLAFAKHGAAYAAIEGRSMMIGAIAFFAYSQLVSCLILRYKLDVVVVSSASVFLWLLSAFAFWAVLLK
jgi:uncharacterized membrane protein (GlpM family)